MMTICLPRLNDAYLLFLREVILENSKRFKLFDVSRKKEIIKVCVTGSLGYLGIVS